MLFNLDLIAVCRIWRFRSAPHAHNAMIHYDKWHVFGNVVWNAIYITNWRLIEKFVHPSNYDCCNTKYHKEASVWEKDGHTRRNVIHQLYLNAINNKQSKQQSCNYYKWWWRRNNQMQNSYAAQFSVKTTCPTFESSCWTVTMYQSTQISSISQNSLSSSYSFTYVCVSMLMCACVSIAASMGQCAKNQFFIRERQVEFIFTIYSSLVPWWSICVISVGHDQSDD